jgi:hypothetical protein
MILDKRKEARNVLRDRNRPCLDLWLSLKVVLIYYTKC